MAQPKKGRQRKIKAPGQPAPRWPQFMRAAHNRIAARGGYKKKPEIFIQLADEIARNGDGEAFLKAVRRGRPTQRQNLRYRLLREIEMRIGAGVPRRREDRNTPEAAKSVLTLELRQD